jgi:hypothetical protein
MHYACRLIINEKAGKKRMSRCTRQQNKAKQGDTYLKIISEFPNWEIKSEDILKKYCTYTCKKLKEY